MDYSYNYHKMYLKENNPNEALNETTSSQNPYKVFLDEVLVEYLRELAIYLIQLKKLGITNEKIKENIIETISIGISNVEYKEEYFLGLITRIYNEMLQSKELYIDVCKRNNIKFKLIKSNLKNPSKLNFSDLIRQGQKNFNLKYTKFNLDQMSLIEVYMNIVKSLCIHLIELKMLGYDNEQAYETLLLILTWKSVYRPSIHKVLPKKIKELVEIDNKLLRQIHEIKREKYGEMEPSDVSATTRQGKSILVAGSNLKELELILEATKDKGINVYTHGHLISAHSYPKFKTYPHLVGHFGKDLYNYKAYFAEFPGTIFLTRNSFIDVEKLFQCRIYTSDPIASKGVGLIKNNDFENLIESSLHSEGFEETTEREPIKLTLSEKFLEEKAMEAAEKFKNGELKYFLVIGVSNETTAQEEYFKRFLKLLDNTFFVLSFSYFDNNNSNIVHIESDYGSPIFYNVIDILTKDMDIKQLDPIICFTRCETHTFSNLLYLKLMGIDKIYFTECPTSLINPAITAFIRKNFGIKDYTTPDNDLREMKSKIL